MPTNVAMAARVRTSASAIARAIPTRGRGGTISGWEFNSSSAVAYNAVARVSRSVSTFSSSQREELILGGVVKCGVGVVWCLGVGEVCGVSRVVSSHLVIEPEASAAQGRRRRWTS